MRFLRESAVEQVLEGHHDAARDQQGDVRRMSASSATLALEPAPVGRRRDHRAPGHAWRSWRSRAGTRVVVGVRERAAAGGRGRAGAERVERARSGRADGGASRRALEKVGARVRGASRWCCRIRSPSCRCVRFEKIPAKAQDLDQLIRWQMRKAAPFKIEDAQVSLGPGQRRCGRRPRVRRHGRAPRHRRELRARVRRAPAPTRASSIWPAST